MTSGDVDVQVPRSFTIVTFGSWSKLELSSLVFVLLTQVLLRLCSQTSSSCLKICLVQLLGQKYLRGCETVLHPARQFLEREPVSSSHLSPSASIVNDSRDWTVCKVRRKGRSRPDYHLQLWPLPHGRKRLSCGTDALWRCQCYRSRNGQSPIFLC